MKKQTGLCFHVLLRSKPCVTGLLYATDPPFIWEPQRLNSEVTFYSSSEAVVEKSTQSIDQLTRLWRVRGEYPAYRHPAYERAY